MIKAAVDANILASGALTNSTPPGQILDAWQAGHFELIISQHVLDEVARTLGKPYFRTRLTPEQIELFEQLLVEAATIVSLTVQVSGVATHPEDDLVLATAVSGDADYLVTGDRRLRSRVPNYQGVELMAPAEFLAILERQAH